MSFVKDGGGLEEGRVGDLDVEGVQIAEWKRMDGEWWSWWRRGGDWGLIIKIYDPRFYDANAAATSVNETSKNRQTLKNRLTT